MAILRTIKTFFLLLCLLFAALVLLQDLALAEMRIFELQHRPAYELAEIVRSVASETVRVSAHRNTLVVNADPAELTEIARLVEDYDRAQQMLRITVEQGAGTDNREQDAGAVVRSRSESVNIDLGSHRRPNDNSVFISTGDVRAGIRGQDHRISEQRRDSHFISVLEGYPASIRVGRAIPFTSELRYYWNRHPHYVATTEYVNVDTGFEVVPEIQGEMVQLEIRPFMAFLDADEPEQIVFHELSTRVRVPLGSWYEFGGQNSTLRGLSREILKTGSQSGRSANSIRVRVDPG